MMTMTFLDMAFVSFLSGWLIARLVTWWEDR